MKIVRLSNIILGSLLIIGIGIGYVLWEMKQDQYSVWIIPVAILLAGIFVLRGQIDYWWFKKFPPPLDPEVISWLQNRFPYYAELNEGDQSKFRDRLSLYLEGREFKIMQKKAEDLPHDFRVMISSHGILMGLYKEDFLIGDFDRIMCYQHAFPTPKFKFLHTVEVHEEDGLYLFSTEHILLGILRPETYFNILFYGYAQAFSYLDQDFKFPDFTDQIWTKFKIISGFTKEQIRSLLGFEEPNPVYIAMSLYFTHAELFRKTLPDWAEAIDTFLNRPAL